MRRWHYRWILVIVLLLTTGLMSGCQGGEQAGAELDVAEVQRGSLVSSISAVGTVRAGSEVALSFETPGKVVIVAVQEGERVEKGQLLAQLDQTELELQVRSAGAALAAAQAQLESLQEGPRPEEISAAEGRVAAAQAALDQAVAQYDQLVSGATEAEIAAAKAQLATLRRGPRPEEITSAVGQVAAAQASLDQALAQYDQLTSGATELDIAAAQAAVSSAQANYKRVQEGPTPEELAQSQAALDSADAALRQAQAAYDKVASNPFVGMLPESLNLQKATIEKQRAQANYDALVNHPTPAELAEAQAQLAQAEARLAQLESSVEPQLRVAKAAVDAAQAQRDIAQAQLDLLRAGAGDAEIASAEAQVEQAQVALDTAHLASRQARLEAPMEGTVASIRVDTGESVSPQMPAMTLVGDSRFTMEADVDEADIGWIEVGQEVKITFDAFVDQEIVGRVLVIAPLASIDLGIVSYRVIIESQETSLPLRAGMTANTEIVKERRDNALLVPNLAIALEAESGRKFVDRRTPAGLEQVEIETGLTTDIYSEVLSGLQEGDFVAISSLSAREQFRDLMGATFSGAGGE